MDALGVIIIVGSVIALGYYKTPLAASKFFAGFLHQLPPTLLKN